MRNRRRRNRRRRIVELGRALVVELRRVVAKLPSSESHRNEMTTSSPLPPISPVPISRAGGSQNSSPRPAKLFVNLCVRMWNTLLSHTHPSTTKSRFMPLTSPPRVGFLRLNPFAVRSGKPSGSSSSNFTDFQGLAPWPAPLIVSPSMLFGIGVPSPSPEGVESVSSSIASHASFSPASTAPRPLTPAAPLPLARVIIR